ncbi:Distantly related to plant expansins [Trametes cinnabarina]|uniref:Distantly related to plant expansins n=1 Tax=Pycnoporus cinnabarinus TaxID=5643 RepID=A0A060S8C3_PYCCI|nr:Distantly related to plant expansins [Trametes cinnabarina]
MFAFASRFRLTVLFVVLASSLVLAHSNGHNVKRLQNGRRHASVNALEHNTTLRLQKRFENTRFTFFPVGQNACGSFDHDSDFIVAINTHQWDGGSHCYEKITVDYQGKSTGAMITDECEECPFGAIDLSPSLFSYLAGSTNPGQIYGSWNFGGGAAPSVTTMPQKSTTTSTRQQPTTTPTPTPTPTPSSTTHKTTSHKTSTSTSTTPSSTSTSSATPSSTSTSSAEPTTTVTSFDTGTLDSFGLAMLQLVGLQNAIFANPDISL